MDQQLPRMSVLQRVFCRKMTTQPVIDKYSLRNSHTSALSIHHLDAASRIPIHDRSVAINRAPSLPALHPDNSVECLSETKLRRSIHHDILSNNAKVFCRTDSQATKFQIECKLRSKGLGELHALKDPHEKRTFTYSKIPETNIEHNVEDLRDFTFSYPHKERTSGYSQNHVRSILRLDSLGPNDSIDRMIRIGKGELPATKNLDRYANSIKKERTLSSFSIDDSESSLAQNKLNVSTKTYEYQTNYQDSRYTSRDRSAKWYNNHEQMLLSNKRKAQKLREKEILRAKMKQEATILENDLEEFENKLQYAMMRV